MFNEKEGKERRKRNDGVVVKKFFPRLLYLWVLLIADVAFFMYFCATSSLMLQTVSWRSAEIVPFFFFFFFAF